jgi:hypothetical protein
MNFITLFQGKYSKKNAVIILEVIKKNPSRMEELMDCFLGEDIRITQRSAWPLGMLGEHAPELIRPYNPTLLKLVKDEKSTDTVVRNILRTWKEMSFDEEEEGEIFDVCFDLFLNHKKAIAIRVFSMYVCTNICCKYPELAVEIIPEIEANITHDSPAIRSSSKNCLQKLHKIKT